MRPTILIVGFIVSLLGAASAQDEKAQNLEKAKEKFQKDIAKAEEGFLASIDKAIAQAGKSGNLKLQQSLTFARPLFVEKKLMPRDMPAENYLHLRRLATSNLLKAYQPTITELTKAKKIEETNALEDTLDELLKSARGYGLAFPDLGAHPVLLIENVKTGMVIDSLNDGGTGELVLNNKLGARRPTQCWRIDQEEKGFVFHNVKSNHNMDVFGGNRAPGVVISTWPYDSKKDVNPPGRFKLTGIRRQLMIESEASGLILTATDRVNKGSVMTYVTQEKKEEPPSPAQLWRLIEVK